MRFSAQPPLLSTTSFRRVITTALIYFAATLPTKLLLIIIPDGTEVRFSACVPVVLGIIWGPAGAIGSALGNFLGDLVLGYPIYIYIWGAISNFFIAYIPYKLWYSFTVNNKTPLFIHDTHSFLKFLVIILFNSLIVSTMLTALLESVGIAIPAQSFFIFFSNNFDFPLLLGIPILLFLRKTNINFVLPPVKPFSTKRYLTVLILLIVNSSYFLFTGYFSNNMRFQLANYSLIINTCLLAYLCTIPGRYNPKYFTDNSSVFYSISSRVTANFLQLAILAILFISFSIIMINPSLIYLPEKEEQWHTIFSTMLFCINIIFLAVFFILRNTEQTMVQRLVKLTKSAHEFSQHDYLEVPKPLLMPSINTNAKDELDDLTESFQKMTKDIRHYVIDLSCAVAEKENLATQLQIAAEIQQSRLPNAEEFNNKLKNYYLFAQMTPAREIGGDLYDCFYLDDNHFVILIADVSGKGIPAALFMMTTKTLLKSNAALSPGKILTKTNNTLCEGNDNMMFVTAWLGIVELDSGKIIYANAGHNPPLLQQANSSPEWLKSRSGPALGIMPNINFKDYTTNIHLGGKLLLYTDGITEATNSLGEFFGNERLFQQFQDVDNPKDLLSALTDFGENTEQDDDITLLWLEYNQKYN